MLYSQIVWTHSASLAKLRVRSPVGEVANTNNSLRNERRNVLSQYNFQAYLILEMIEW